MPSEAALRHGRLADGVHGGDGQAGLRAQLYQRRLVVLRPLDGLVGPCGARGGQGVEGHLAHAGQGSGLPADDTELRLVRIHLDAEGFEASALIGIARSSSLGRRCAIRDRSVHLRDGSGDLLEASEGGVLADEEEAGAYVAFGCHLIASSCSASRY